MIISDFKILERILKPNNIYNLYYFKSLKGFSLDSRSIVKGEAFVAIRGKHYNGHNFIKKAVAKGASLIIAEEYVAVTPKVPFYVVESTYQALRSIAVYIRKKKNPFVCAITGSLGKTTTKEMLSFLLSPYYKVLANQGTENNFLGVVKTIFSLQDHKMLILELGTNKKGEIKDLTGIAAPNLGLITFIKPVHLEGLENLKGVFNEKISLFEGNPKMKVVLNHDDPYLAKISGSGKIYWFGKNRNNHLFVRLKKGAGRNPIFLIQDKYELILSDHREGFIINAMAALLTAKIIGIPLKSLVERMNHFKNSLPLRMQADSIKGFFILNDAYNANPYSFQSAFESLKKCSLRKIAVVGDMLELGKKNRYYHELLAKQIMNAKVSYCLTLGENTLFLNKKLKSLGYKKAFHFLSQEAVAQFINKEIGISFENRKRYLIFLKGSRKMEVEKIIKYLK